MSDSAPTMDQVLEEVGFIAEWEAKGEVWGKREAARNALNEGLSVDFIQKITGLPLEAINKLAAESKIEVARDGLAKGYPIETLNDLTELSLETIKKLASDEHLRQDTGINLGLYLETVFKANIAVFREALITDSNLALTINQVLEDVGYAAKWVARGFAGAKPEIARNALNEGFSVDSIQRITGLPLEAINKLAAEVK